MEWRTCPRWSGVAVPLPGRWGRALRDGDLLPGPGAQLGAQTFDQYLETVRRAA